MITDPKIIIEKIYEEYHLDDSFNLKVGVYEHGSKNCGFNRISFLDKMCISIGCEKISLYRSEHFYEFIINYGCDVKEVYINLTEHDLKTRHLYNKREEALYDLLD